MSEIFASPRRGPTLKELNRRREREQQIFGRVYGRLNSSVKHDQTVVDLVEKFSKLSVKRIQQAEEIEKLKTNIEKLEKEVIDLRRAGGIPRCDDDPPLGLFTNYDPYGDVAFVNKQ